MQPRTQGVSTFAAGDAAVLQRNRDVFIWVGAAAKEQPLAGSARHLSSPVEPSSAMSVIVAPAASAPSSPWDCIAEAETGSDYSMTGSTYSTAFGVINDIVYQYGSPGEQAQIFSGTASKETQIAVVSRFAAEHGFGGWGVLTKQKCGL